MIIDGGTPFLPLFKADAASRTIWARAAVEEPDKAREIMDYATAKPQFEAWSKQFSDATMGKSLGNIRAMHNPRHLAGKVQEMRFDDAGKSVEVCIKVLDPVDWTKVEEGGYTGLSIGGGYLKKWKDGDLTRYTPRISEISLVDAPCIPGARFLELQKSDGSIEEVMLKGQAHTFLELLPPPSFAEMHRAGLRKAALGPIIEGTLAAAEHVTPHGGGYHMPLPGQLSTSYRNEATGKVFSNQNPPREPREKWGYLHPKNKPISGEVDPGKKISYESRGKTYTSHSTERGFSKRAPGLNKILLPLAYSAAAGLAGHVVGSKLAGKLARAVAGRVERSGADESTKIATHLAVPIAHQAGGLGLSAYTGTVGWNKGVADEKAAEKQAPAAESAKREKIATVMREHKAGTLRSWRGINPRTGKPRKGPKVTDRKQAIAIALNQARRMDKTEAISDALRKRKLHESIEHGAHEGGHAGRNLGAAVGAGVGFLRGGLGGAVGGGLGGLVGGHFVGRAVGASAGAAHHLATGGGSKKTTPANLSDEENTEGRTDTTGKVSAKGGSSTSHLSEKQHAQRVTAAKARWLKEGHHDLDAHYDALHQHASKALLGRANKVAAVAQQRQNAWHAVADAHAAYDKVKPHMPADSNLMMEVPHSSGLLLNPEGVGGGHFDANGRPHKDLFLLHPAEADDWIRKHGKDAKSVAKMAPSGRVLHFRDLSRVERVERAA